MARQEKRLSAVALAKLGAGRHADGDGLYLQVDPSGARRWVYQFQLRNRARAMGLGPFPEIRLADAREKARDARKLVKSGTDPIDARRIEAASSVTFGEFADEFMAGLGQKTKDTRAWNPKHKKQWEESLTKHAALLRPMRLDAITTEHILRVLKPLWNRVPATASRVRGRIERVLDAARARKLRSGDNPAAWRGHLEHLDLAKPSKNADDRRQPAMPWADVPAFIAKLRKREGVAPMALEFLVLTGARSGEVLGAKWDEIDLDAKVWTVPAARTKTAKVHRVPLSTAAMAVLDRARQLRDGDFIFPGRRRGGRLTPTGLAIFMRQGMKIDGAVPHGFRSSFRDWCSEHGIARDLAELSLAHMVGNKTEQAYHRTDLLEQRRPVMEKWGQHCVGETVDNVVLFQAREVVS
ncbi:Integrase [Rhizobiales bacterium GAS191]|nr:Integrase [Rhizobiales bacterium GAS191]